MKKVNYRLEVKSEGFEGVLGSLDHNRPGQNLAFWLNLAATHFIDASAFQGYTSETVEVRVRGSEGPSRVVVTANERDDDGKWMIRG